MTKCNFDTPWDKLCHDVRNALFALGGLTKHMKSADRLLALRELKRIEQALVKHEICLTNGKSVRSNKKT